MTITFILLFCLSNKTRKLNFLYCKAYFLILKGKQIEAQKSMFKPPTIPKEVEKYEEPVDIHALLADVTLMKLKSIFEEVMKRQREKVDNI